MMGLRVTQYYIFVIRDFCVSSDEIRLDQSPAVVKRPGETVKISLLFTDGIFWFTNWMPTHTEIRATRKFQYTSSYKTKKTTHISEIADSPRQQQQNNIVLVLNKPRE
ncbi:hypothetical protein Q7C36_017088 [Tachysurus vachellii]|uniref:Uncharacterized protein n=1 Tax=Tachysurus vachellii TaxID=175792 RepID=A0AA88M2A9_TACVA|nr:hypothetical protein Q7C36_017088 [Tachysurus vachellii]